MKLVFTLRTENNNTLHRTGWRGACHHEVSTALHYEAATTINVSTLTNARFMQSQTSLSYLPYFLKEDTGLECQLPMFISVQQNTFRINWPTFIKPDINTTLFVSSTSFSHLIPYCQWWRFVRMTWQPAMLALHGTLVECTEIKIGSRI
jgi:hypothetical protein